MRPCGRSTQTGLTLIELLIVMAILALATSVVIINAPPARNAARVEAEGFELALRGAVDEAVITGGAYRVEMKADEWRIARFSNGEWETVSGSTEDARAGAVFMSVEVEDAAKSNAASLYGAYTKETPDRDAPTLISIEPFGETPEFAATFRNDGISWQVRHLASGRIEIERS